MSAPDRPSAAIYGVSGTVLTEAERAFFARTNPLGFIVFLRNCEAPDQVRTLIRAMRESVGRADAPVMIDQEGGRVTRFKPPHWRKAPAAGRFATLARQGLDKAAEATRLNARLIAAELIDAGVTVNCLPVLDLALAGAHDVIGDRAFGADPKVVAALGGAQADGLLDGGVIPVMKHMPGHGRSLVDSHEKLPTVDTDLKTLEASDFAPFRALASIPWGMSCHVVYTAIDPRPATLSPVVIDRVIRGHIGFKGLLFTDDIGMGALPGSLGSRSRAALAAGCDVILHCTGDMDEMVEVAEAASPLTDAALASVAEGEARRRRSQQPIDFAAASARVEQLLAAA
ncbi:MAG: beta-N-acetylhexosaminidase [Alphaproteobacteria bacterium]|nr:beta-N-acetylhexosaminidase [Alphaproteobacteria bacterium]